MSCKSLSEAINWERARTTRFNVLEDEQVHEFDSSRGVGLIAHYVCDTVGVHDATNFGFEIRHLVDRHQAWYICDKEQVPRNLDGSEHLFDIVGLFLN